MSRQPAPELAIRLLLLVESVSFALAALIHFGILLHGYEHRQAGTAETLIAGVLLLGLALTVVGLVPTRGAGVAAQALALLGTLVGVFTIAIGVGPRTTPDIVYHVGIVALLVFGLVYAARTTADGTMQPG